MFIRRSAGARSTALLLFGLLAIPSLPTAARAAENPFEDLASVEEARLLARAGKPEAVGPLLALFGMTDMLRPGHLDALVRRLLEASGPERADPLVAARARDWWARRLEQQGEDAAAVLVREPLGNLGRVWVVGPFGDGRASVDVLFPPEEESVLPEGARSYVGKERKVSWRKAEGAMRRGAIDLGALLRPQTQGAAYVQTFVHVERATLGALRLGTPGPVKVWCNGGLVHGSDRVRSARLDQDAVPVELRAGWNRVLIKTVVTEGNWRIFARLTAPDGGPLSFINEWLPQAVPTARHVGASLGAKGQAPSLHRRAVRALEPLLRERVRAAGTNSAEAAEAGLDLGRYLLAVDSADRDQREAARAFEASAARRPSVLALIGLAQAGREEDESRRALERALALGPAPRDRAAVLTALGDIARDQHRESAAVERWRAALASDRRWWPATLSLAGEAQSAGLMAAALAELDALPISVRAVPAVMRERTRLLMALDRRKESEAMRRTLLVNGRDEADLLRELAHAAQIRGDAPQSLQLLERAALARPDLPSLTIEWARALEGARVPEAARASLESAARRLPDEPSLAAELGKLLDRMRDTVGALAWLRTALELRPQDPELRRYRDAVSARPAAKVASPGAAPSPGAASTVGGEAPHAEKVELARRFAAAVEPLLAKAARGGKAVHAADLPQKGEGGPDPAVVLLDRRAVRVHPNGLSEAFSQRVVEIRTDSGAQDNKEFFVRYTPGSEEVEILEARIFRPGAGGKWDILQASDRDDQDLSEPWYGLYYDYRAQVIRFEGMRAGDVLDVQYVISDVSRENQLAGYFGDLQFIGEALPKLQWDYTLLAPAARAFYFARPTLAGMKESSAVEGGERITRFEARDVRRIEVEPAMPGIAEVSPYLHISTYKNWDEVGRWYWRLIEEQLIPDDAVRRAAEGAVRAAEIGASAKGLAARVTATASATAPSSEKRTTSRRRLTDLEKVRAMHGLVLSGTRYVGLEFGIHGFKPYKVSQVLSRKFGDCKDKAALLTALLTHVGVEAEMVLLRTRRGGRIAPSPASLAVFDHAIVFIPKLGLYLDGTAEFSGMKELPNQDQGVMVLRVGPRGTKLVQTPVSPSGENRALRTWTVRLKGDGEGEVVEKLSIEGQAAPEWRSHYQTPGERMDRYAKVWTGRNPGARLESLDMAGIDDRNRAVDVRATATVPRVGERTADGGLLLPVGARDADLVRTYARLSSRRSDLVLAYPWQHQETITYELPAGLRATSLPRARTIETSFGRFVLRIETVGAGTITAQSRLVVERDRVSPVDYPAFRRFLAEVDAAMAERIVLAPVAERAGALMPSEQSDVRRPALAPAPASAAARAATPGPSRP